MLANPRVWVGGRTLFLKHTAEGRRHFHTNPLYAKRADKRPSSLTSETLSTASTNGRPAPDKRRNPRVQNEELDAQLKDNAELHSKMTELTDPDRAARALRKAFEDNMNEMKGSFGHDTEWPQESAAAAQGDPLASTQTEVLQKSNEALKRGS